jgi:serine/threonine protein kinase
MTRRVRARRRPLCLRVCALRVACVLACAIAGCADAGALELTHWELSAGAPSAAVTLPAHLDVPARPGAYTLRTMVVLPAPMRGHRLKLVIDELHALVALRAGGTEIQRDVRAGTRYRSRGPIEWVIPRDDPHARAASVGVTQAGALVGTPRYMAPEVIRDSATIATSADVFAFGVIAWEVLAGRTPFERALIHCMLADEGLPPAPLLAMRWEGPPEIVALVDRCVSYESAQRPSAAELAEGFRAVLAGAGPPA